MTNLKALTKLSVLLFLYSHQLHAKWICQETASLKEGQNVLSCGVGEGETEALARENAFQNAKKEFHSLCQEDVNCKGYKTTIEPLRNSCEKTSSGYKCYRGIDYKITNIKASEAELKNIEEELEKKQKEYEEAKKLYEKQKELEDLNKKIANKDFSDSSNSQWNHFFLIGVQLGIDSVIGDKFSLSNFSTSITAQYIPKSRWGILLKSFNFNINDTAPTSNDSYSTYSTSVTPISYKTDGSIRSASIIYYFNDLTNDAPSSGFVGFGVGKAKFNFNYLFQNNSDFSNQEESDDVDTNVNLLTLGYSSSTLFSKKGLMGLGLGMDFYSFASTTPHHLKSVLDFNLSIMWGF